MGPVLDLGTAGNTPVLREYRRIRGEYPGAILMARLGDFYELFGADAEIAAPILGVTLTARGFGKAGRLPMCGVPHHAATGYIRRLLDAGHAVVLWDQVGEVQAGKLVAREVTRVLSPGTLVEAEYLDEGRTARCVALLPGGNQTFLAALDAASGEMQVATVAGDLGSAALAEECLRLDIAELLVPDSAEVPDRLVPRAVRRRLPASLFDAGRGAERLAAITGAMSLSGLGLDTDAAAIGAVGAVLAYCDRSKVILSGSTLRIQQRDLATVMRLDPQTRRNLELLQPLATGGTPLVGLLDDTRTPMGARLLRQRLQEPLREPALINARLDSVAWFADASRVRSTVREQLGAVRDLERLVNRCVQGIATPRDLSAVRQALTRLPGLAFELKDVPAAELSQAVATLDVSSELCEHLERLLVDDPPAFLRDGGAVRRGADTELDSLLAAGGDARTFIATLEERERERTAIRSLKVGYNRVFGYYIEIPNAHRELVPDDYVRKQTLVGAERYITPDLKEQEIIVLGARERALNREQELLRDACLRVAAEAERLLECSRGIAVIDVSQSLAEAGVRQRWVRPEVDTSTVTDIEAGRHPLVEHNLPAGRFVANDCSLDVSDRIVILTGPNMAGKSTYLRQVALITLLAQIGCLVPAKRARIGVCDRIFTRIGAHDDLSAGLSTFMVEMAETAAILRQATSRSLVILDEIGRGTSTYDGLSIAQAIVEQIHEAPQLNCRTLFATHYHELTALAEWLPRVRNARVEVEEEGESVTFLHRIVAGGADRSYGIHVAKLAGIPASVLSRARTLLAELESSRPLIDSPARADQLDLGIPVPAAHPVVAELTELDIDGLTPLAALNKLAEWRARVY